MDRRDQPTKLDLTWEQMEEQAEANERKNEVRRVKIKKYV